MPTDELLGGIIINPQSPWGQELCKWEQHRTEYVGRGMNPGNPYVYRPWPANMYLARRRDDGRVVCMEPPPQSHLYSDMAQFERACLFVETTNRQNMCEVANQVEKDRRWADGWRDSPTDALAHFESLQRDIERAAAEVQFHAQRMSPEARAELRKADESTHEHVTDLKPARKRGRPVVKRQIAVSESSE